MGINIRFPEKTSVKAAEKALMFSEKEILKKHD